MNDMSAVITYTIGLGEMSFGTFTRLEHVRDYIYHFSIGERYKFNGMIVFGSAVRWPFPQAVRRIRIHPFTGRVVLERYRT